jgi:hypothetical protein
MMATVVSYPDRESCHDYSGLETLLVLYFDVVLCLGFSLQNTAHYGLLLLCGEYGMFQALSTTSTWPSSFDFQQSECTMR